MYVTRPRSVCRNFPGTLSIPPPESPSSAYLVVTDEESEQKDAFCWGLCKNTKITKLPFPQDRLLKVVHLSEYEERTVTKVWFLPVLDQPLSSNRYHVIKAKGKYKGKACVCSREEDMMKTLCCSRDIMKDLKPRPFNHTDIYQQVEICSYYNGGFFAKSLAHDGFPPKFLRRKGWELHIAHSFRIRLREAQGLNGSQLLNLPELNVPLSHKRSLPITVGKWYCPFVFVKEEARVRDQMKKSLFYELAHEIWWEEIYSCNNENNQADFVIVNATVQREVTQAYGIKALKDERQGDDGFVWFRARENGQNRRRGRQLSVGLSSIIIEKMRRVQQREGWVDGGDREVRVERREEMRSENGWTSFFCYVLVHSFALRRIDGSLLLRRNFRHTPKVQCKWEQHEATL